MIIYKQFFNKIFIHFWRYNWI